MRNFYSDKGFTILELTVVIIIFLLFLIAVYTILDAGLDAWNIGKNRSDIQNSGEIFIRRIVKEISMACKDSLIIDNSTYHYIVMETPLRNGEYAYDPIFGGSPLWEGYIIYFAFNESNSKTIYRRYMAHNENSMATPINIINPADFFKPSYSPPPPADSYTQKPVLTSVDTFDLSQDNGIINIKVVSRKEPQRKGKIYSVSGTSKSKGTEIFELQTSAFPRN